MFILFELRQSEIDLQGTIWADVCWRSSMLRIEKAATKESATTWISLTVAIVFVNSFNLVERVNVEEGEREKSIDKVWVDGKSNGDDGND